MPRYAIRLALPAAALLVALTGCSSAAPAEQAPTASAAAQAAVGWPRTVTTGVGETRIASTPERIVALSSETAGLALRLVGAERIAAVPEGALLEHADAAELAAAVPTVLPTSDAPEPESVLALDPDLVLLTERHQGEVAVAEQLRAAGMTVLSFGEDEFSTPEAVAASLRTLGEALGANAEPVAKAFEQRIDAASGAADAAGPRVLGLMARGGTIMATGPEATVTTLLRLAGAQAVADERGRPTSPIDAEALLALDPELLLVEDFHGAGLGPFGELLAQLGDAAPRVELVPGELISASAGLGLAEGLERIEAIVR